MPPSLFEELVYAKGVVHPDLETLTFRRELGVPILFRPEGQDHTSMAVTKPPEFSYYDWPFLLGKMKTKFPKLRTLRFSKHGLDEKEQQSLLEQVKKDRISLEFVEP